MAESHPIENWRPVVGYEGLYEVSDLGRVFSLRKRRAKKLTPNTHGHLRFNASRGGDLQVLYVHRIVLRAFVGPCPDGMEACHNNGVRSDNRLTNLRWDTKAGNEADKVRHGTSNRGERCGHAKHTARQVCKFLAALADGEGMAAAAKRCGIAYGQASRIHRGITWAHLWRA